MKWFFALKEKYRLLIVATLLAPLFLTVCFVDFSANELPVGPLVVVLLTSAVGFVFLFAAARAHDQEKKAEKERLEKEKAEAEAKRMEEIRQEAIRQEESEAEAKAFFYKQLTGFNYEQKKRDNIVKREFKGESLLSLIDDYIVVDLETTGLSPSDDEIIEIGAIRYVNNVEVERFCTFVSVDFPLPRRIVRHTGITDAMLEGAPKIADVLPQFLDFVGNSVIIAHNANFDINFLYDNALRHLGLNFTNDFVDTLYLARQCRLPVENHKLGTLAEHFGISQETAHRSAADCETTHALYAKLKEYIKINNLMQASGD